MIPGSVGVLIMRPGMVCAVGGGGGLCMGLSLMWPIRPLWGCSELGGCGL